MKRIFLMILVIGVLLLGACGESSGNGITHYVSEEFSYSIDYPEDWIMEELDPNRIGIAPSESGFNQIQVNAYLGEPTIASTPDTMVQTANESDLQQFADTLGDVDLTISVNERSSGKWDWVAAFTLTYEDVPLEGGLFIKETETITYTIFFLQSEDWPEGQEVIDSFSVIE